MRKHVFSAAFVMLMGSSMAMGSTIVCSQDHPDHGGGKLSYTLSEERTAYQLKVLEIKRDAATGKEKHIEKTLDNKLKCTIYQGPHFHCTSEVRPGLNVFSLRKNRSNGKLKLSQMHYDKHPETGETSLSWWATLAEYLSCNAV